MFFIICRLKPDSVPSTNVIDYIFVKEERHDIDEFTKICDEQLVNAVINDPEIEVSNRIKLEKASTNSHGNENFVF